MGKYNYYAALEEDVNNYIKEHVPNLHARYEDVDAAKEELNKEMWACDSVTGNGSGSYTFNTWEAEENICNNLDLLQEVNEEFGGSYGLLKDGAEACDVAIRCYLLGQTVDEVVGELWEEEEEKKKENLHLKKLIA